MIERGEKTRLFSLPFEASHLCENFLAAAAVCRTLGLDWEEIFSKSSKLSPYKMRFERIEKKGVVYINDSYNANPASVTAALRNLPKPIKGGKTWAVLGEMRELGAFSKEAHEQIGKEASLHVDELLCLGKECLPLFDVFLAQGLPAFYFDELADLKQALAQKVQEGDVVLIKASKSLQMWKVLEEEKKG